MLETCLLPNGMAARRAAQPILEVYENDARSTWADAVLTHPELQGKGRRNMQRVVMYMAMSVRYDPRLPNYGKCWPTVSLLAGWYRLDRRTVQKILRRLEELDILTVEYRRPEPNLYTLDICVDPWQYCHLVDDGRNDGWRVGDTLPYYPPPVALRRAAPGAPC